jgi:hypothetical protein
MALVITLLLLAAITFMAITFLVVSRSEKGAVTTQTDMALARLAADTAMERAKAEALASIIAYTNPFSTELTVSTNYIRPGGFIRATLTLPMSLSSIPTASRSQAGMRCRTSPIFITIRVRRSG